MLRRLALLSAVFVMSLSYSAHGQSQNEEASAPGQVEQGLGTDPQPDGEDSQEIGALLGVAMGGSVTPGGLVVEGRYLYRLSELDWLETSVHFSLGAGGKECFRDRQNTFVCEHGLLDGFATEGSVGLRRYFVGQKQFRPYLRAGIGAQLISYGDDDVIGLGLPLYLGAGIRVAVANRVLVVADATARAGVAFVNQDLGLEPNLSLTITSGVEFTLE